MYVLCTFFLAAKLTVVFISNRSLLFKHWAIEIKVYFDILTVTLQLLNVQAGQGTFTMP